MPPATGAARCSSARGKQIVDVAHALGDTQHYPMEVVGFLSPTPLPANGLRSLGSLDDLDDVLSSERIDELIIADPDFPQDDAVELVDQCHQRGIRVTLAPSTMEILIHRAEFVPGQSVPLFELGLARVRGDRLRAEAHVRHHRSDAAARAAEPACCSRSRSPCA